MFFGTNTNWKIWVPKTYEKKCKIELQFFILDCQLNDWIANLLKFIEIPHFTVILTCLLISCCLLIIYCLVIVYEAALHEVVCLNPKFKTFCVENKLHPLLCGANNFWDSALLRLCIQHTRCSLLTDRYSLPFPFALFISDFCQFAIWKRLSGKSGSGGSK